MIDHVHDTESYKYADRVLSGEQIASRFIIQAAERFMNDLDRDDLIFDLDAVKEIDEFFSEVIYVPELGEPKPIQPPHAFWIHQLYGFKYKEIGVRRFKSVYVQVARKNFKTFYAAAISLYELILGSDPTAQIMHGANSRDQAIICTEQTGKLVAESPEIHDFVKSNHLKIFTYKEKANEIVFKKDDRFCRIEAMPKNPGDGKNPSIGIVDEFQESVGTELFTTIKTGSVLRKEPYIVVITSPGSNKYGPCYQMMRKRSVDMLEGKNEDDRHLAIIFELDQEDEWDEIDMLVKSNPMKDYVPSMTPFLVDQINEAKISGGAVEAEIKIKNCGIWIDAPLIWIPSETIRKNNYGTNLDLLARKKCYGGLDLSAGKDLNAFVLFFPDIGDGIKAVRCMFWIPEDKILNQKDDGVDYRKWVDEGFIHVFEGNVVDYNVIARMMVEMMEPYDVVSMGCDPKYLYTGPVSWINENANEYMEKIMPVSQGFNLTGATEMVEQWTAKGEMEFFNNPVMEMCFSNTTLHMKDSGNVQEGGISGHKFPSKGKSKGRIDGVSALVTALHEYLRLSVEPEPIEPVIEVWN